MLSVLGMASWVRAAAVRAAVARRYLLKILIIKSNYYYNLICVQVI
jgi:hypothetical protein